MPQMCSCIETIIADMFGSPCNVFGARAVSLLVVALRVAQQTWRGPGAHSKRRVPPVGTRGSRNDCIDCQNKTSPERTVARARGTHIRNDVCPQAWMSRLPLPSQLHVRTNRRPQASSVTSPLYSWILGFKVPGQRANPEPSEEPERLQAHHRRREDSLSGTC